MANLFYSRYHVSSAKDYSNKIDFLMIGLSNKVLLEKKGSLFQVFHNEIFEYENVKYITGELVKYKPTDSEEVVDVITRSIKIESIQNKIVARIRYIIDPTTSLLMHFDNPKALTLPSFRTIFSELFIKNHDNFFTEFTLAPIREEYSFIEQIKTFKSVQKISITLYPSNPNFRQRWQAIDEKLRKNEIEKYKETWENKKTDSNMKVDEETENKFLMAEDGFGDCFANGITESGEKKTITTKSKQMNVRSYLPNEINKPIDILEKTSEQRKQIGTRTANEK